MISLLILYRSNSMTIRQSQSSFDRGLGTQTQFWFSSYLVIMMTHLQLDEADTLHSQPSVMTNECVLLLLGSGQITR